MMGLVARLIGRAEPSLGEASERDAATIAAVQTASFQRGWGEDEFRGLLLDRNVVCHRAMMGRTLIGFILSRLVAGEAEILSVAIAPGWRGRGFSRPLLDWPDWAPGRCFSKSTKRTRRPDGFTGRPAFTMSAAGKAIMKAGPPR